MTKVKAFLKKTAESIDIKIDAMEVMPDHIHLRYGEDISGIPRTLS